MNTNGNVIEMKNITKSYQMGTQVVHALRGVDLEIKKGETAKMVCRYQQYRAVGKILDRLRIEKTPFERSGVIWHTQGSGKSLTMVSSGYSFFAFSRYSMVFL